MEKVRRSLQSYEQHKIQNLIQLTEYEVMVLAFNEAGKNNSEIVKVKTDPELPHKPLDMTLVKATATTLTIQWDAPENINPGIDICYHINIALLNTITKTSPICNSSINEYEFKHLKMNSTYTVMIYASIKRPRDQKELYGETVESIYKTGLT